MSGWEEMKKGVFVTTTLANLAANVAEGEAQGMRDGGARDDEAGKLSDEDNCPKAKDRRKAETNVDG